MTISNWDAWGLWVVLGGSSWVSIICFEIIWMARPVKFIIVGMSVGISGGVSKSTQSKHCEISIIVRRSFKCGDCFGFLFISESMMCNRLSLVESLGISG